MRILVLVVLVSVDVILTQEEDDNDEVIFPDISLTVNTRFRDNIPFVPNPEIRSRLQLLDTIEDDDDARRKRQISEEVPSNANQNKSLIKPAEETGDIEAYIHSDTNINKDVPHKFEDDKIGDENAANAYKSNIPKSKSKCCNAELVNVFHYMDLEARHLCFKKYQIQNITAEKQVKHRACIAECVAKHKRYITTKGKIFISELTITLKIAFQEMEWVMDIIDEIINTCVENYEIFTDTEVECRTKTLNIGICIGRKLQYECYENHLEDENACLQRFFDVKYYKCVAASPGFGCHTIR